MIKEYTFLIFIFLHSFIYADPPDIDSIVNLSAVKITANRIDDFSIGLKTQKLDTLVTQLNRFSNLGEILSRNTTLQIKPYNHNGLSLISFRGTAAHHTGIFWNGFQINPSNNGQMDLSLIPGSVFNDITILYGGSSSFFGSGNIGGSIHLKNNEDFRRGLLQVNAGKAFGSFGENNGSVRFSMSDGKWYTNSSAIYNSSINNFSYQNLNGENIKQENAAFRQIGFMQDAYRNIHNKSVLGFSFWYQFNDREIPATLTSKPSDAYQIDKSVRTMISYRRYITNGEYSVRSGYLTDDMHYVDADPLDILNIDSKIKTNKFINEFLYKKPILENSDLNTGVTFIYEKGSSSNYDGNVYQRQLGIFIMWMQKFDQIDWRLSINLRQDIIDGYDVPFTPSLGFEGRIWRNISGKINISRNFRIPSFNDRFWIPGGNEDLEPENSWNEEVSIISKFSNHKKFSHELIFTLYNSNVDDWILWVPSDNFWSPQNVQKVWARGCELMGKSTLEINNIMAEINAGYTYALSTNETKTTALDQSYQMQLLYVPKHRFFVNFSVVIKDFVINYNHTYTGRRYTSLDNQNFLPDYSLGFFTFSKDLKIDRHTFGLQFDISNVWNEEYQAVEYNPMPGRYFRLTINYSFVKKDKEK